MEIRTLSHKRPLLDGYEKEPHLSSKKCLDSLTSQSDLNQTEGSDGAPQPKKSCDHKHPTHSEPLFEQISFWADTQLSVSKVLEHFKFRKATNDIFLSDPVNKRFLEFHHDITEECGAEEKQHSWAVIEKQEEIIMYGPYYPNYAKGDHSEDVIIKQTQEFLELEEFRCDWKVYVFSMNSPCLARNTDSCMIKLVQKAQEWWSVYGVKTHICFAKCWGFKGTKETLFRDIGYSQVECINQTEDHEGYVEAMKMRSGLNPLCENLRSAVKHLLGSVNLSFALKTVVQGHDWKSHFKKMHGVFEECEAAEEKNILMQKLNVTVQAAQLLLPGKCGSFEEHVESWKEVPLDFPVGSQVGDALHEEMRLVFRQCWREMVQNKYAELIRLKLTEDFNRCAVQLFIEEMLTFSNEYLHIGKIQFPVEESKGATHCSIMFGKDLGEKK